MAPDNQVTSENTAREASQPLVDLNYATTEELEKLSGIGSALAGRIVEYRETVHLFEEPIEVAAVPGISERMYRDLADRLMVTKPSAVEAEADEAADEAADETGDEERGASEPSVEKEYPMEEPPGETEAEHEDESLPSEPSSLSREETAPGKEAQDESSPIFSSERGLFPRSASWTWLWSALLGGLLGMVFALVVLVGINGSLVIGNSPAVREMRGQMDGLAADIDSLEGQADGLRRRLDSLEGLTARIEQVESAVDDLHAETDQLGGQVETLEEELTAVSGDLAAVQAQAERFDTFLVRLQALLDDLFGAADSSVPAPSSTSTPVLTPTLAFTPTLPARE